MGAVIGQAAFGTPVPIIAEHDLEPFDCGAEPTLNHWLKKRALTNNVSGASRTYVLCVGARVVGYYCLATGGVISFDAPGRIKRNMPDPIPVVIIGRLAVDKAWQGRQLGASLLRDAALRTLKAAEYIGIRAMLVHAISENAKRFYEKYDFVPSPQRPVMLMANIVDLDRYFTARAL